MTETITHALIPVTGYAPYNYLLVDINGGLLWEGLTADEIVAEGKMRKVSFEEFLSIQGAYETKEYLSDDPALVTEDLYHEMLNCLPPLRQGSGYFTMSERLCGDITACYYHDRIADKYYTANVRDWWTDGMIQERFAGVTA